MNKSKILITGVVNDEITSLKPMLEKYFNEVVMANAVEQVPGLVQQKDVDVVIFDMTGSYKGDTGISLLQDILAADPDVEVIPVTEKGDTKTIDQLMNSGAHDFIQMPFNVGRILATVNNGVRLAKAGKRVGLLEEQLSRLQQGNASLNMEENEKVLISKALDKSGGNVSRAAGELGISRKTLYNKLNRYKIETR